MLLGRPVVHSSNVSFQTRRRARFLVAVLLVTKVRRYVGVELVMITGTFVVVV